MSKQWINEKSFSTYEEAAEFKTVLQESSRGATLQIKIHRYESLNGNDTFIVRTRTDPQLESAVKEIEEKLTKTKKPKDKK